MENWALQPGEHPYRIMLTHPGQDPVAGQNNKGELQAVRFYTKQNNRGAIDCLLIYEYADRQAVRQAKDFPPDQFEYFFEGVCTRCPLTYEVIDGFTQEAQALALWQEFTAPEVKAAV
ncbi:hypothetical protein [Heliophilum fasciatum]|uniref:Uncharacterized protein n=1 Tax=Heliophilum fasciatum TaxID=35700 RepID=A0A4R2RNG6_9FIRM|nr:hypothetical protein [Heliophilum fasciatum]MCW2278160.1 hypothetical protein [Heliophilum fasciatum]TCP64229.1 hypothetical protein EDD73_11184 [Heliophilum fasciatum]